MTTKEFWKSRSRSRNRAQSQGPDPDSNRSSNVSSTEKSRLSVPDSGIQSQSSPNTPAQLRKEKRHRSFSPVRSFLNSPLIRRRKKQNSMDSSPIGKCRW